MKKVCPWHLIFTTLVSVRAGRKSKLSDLFPWPQLIIPEIRFFFFFFFFPFQKLDFVPNISMVGNLTLTWLAIIICHHHICPEIDDFTYCGLVRPYVLMHLDKHWLMYSCYKMAQSYYQTQSQPFLLKIHQSVFLYINKTLRNTSRCIFSGKGFDFSHEVYFAPFPGTNELNGPFCTILSLHVKGKTYFWKQCSTALNTLRQREDGHHFPDDILKLDVHVWKCRNFD